MRYIHVTNIHNTCRWCQQTARRCTPFSKTTKKPPRRLGVNKRKMKMMVRRAIQSLELLVYEALSH